MYDDAVVDLVEFDHFICDSAVLNCSGSFMSLQIFAILWNLWDVAFYGFFFSSVLSEFFGVF